MFRAEQVLGGLLGRDRALIDWVNSREREVFDALRGAQPTDHPDFVLMCVPIKPLSADDPAVRGSSSVSSVPVMPVEIRVPPLGESIAEATVGHWSKKTGHTVRKDEVLVEIETDKVTFEVAAPADGTLRTIHKYEGHTVGANELLAEMEAGAVASTAAMEELELRLQGAGWDEVEVDLAELVVTVKRFRRRVFVTANGYPSEISAPVYQNESSQQAVGRIFAEGISVADYGGSEPGLLCFNAAAIQRVRIPSSKQ